jgi:hypothetical protein
MENYSVEHEAISYSEKKLRELLDYTCDNLYPTDHFKLELQGMLPSALTKNEVEALAGVELDEKTGATIALAYDTNTEALELQSLRHPLDHSGKNAFIIARADSTTPDPVYVAFLDVNGKTDILGPHIEGNSFTKEEIAHILEGYGIDNVPHPADTAYQLWRANLLSTCTKGWKTSEEVELFVDMREHTLETIKVGYKEEYIEGSTNNRTKYVSRIFDTNNDSRSYQQQVQMNLMQTENDYDSSIQMHKSLVETEVKPYPLSGKAIKTEHSDEPIDFDEDSFNAFKSLLEDTALYLHEQM